jgi:SAM-dependent methyltransferase
MRSRIGLILNLLKKRHDPAQILVKLALRNSLEGCESVLDIGCGTAPTMRELGVKHSVGVEGYPPYSEQIRRENLQDELVECDVRDIAKHFQPRQFDACVALDLIEHLTKEDGLKLIQSMETVAKKRVVFFTPSGFLPQRHAANDDLQAHLSGWDADEMRKLGYQVIGLLGPKKLRGEYHRLKGRPTALWALVSLLGQFLHSKSHPEKAAAIMCIKNQEK